MSKIILKCGNEWLKSENLQILRKITNLGYSEICQRIKAGNPIAEFLLLQNNYEELQTLLTDFMIEAKVKELPFELFEIDEDEFFSETEITEQQKITPRMLLNIFESGKEIAKQIQVEDEIRFS